MSQIPSGHDQKLASAFNDQAAQFEKAPVQSDPAALDRLVRAAGFALDAKLLDAGCGPGLVSEAFLRSGRRVVGVDLSPTMIEKARTRCAFAGEAARFVQGSVHGAEIAEHAPFDGAYSRYVLHHILDPRGFLGRQVELVRSGGVIVLCDHITDPDQALARRHQDVEISRDRTHTRNLSGGEILDLFAAVGLQDLSYVEETFTLDFDEWFDRGSPAASKQNVRDILLRGITSRGFRTVVHPNGAIQLNCIRAIARGVKP